MTLLQRLSAVTAGLLLAACPAPTPPDYHKTPVLLIHGVGDTEHVWDRMIDRMVAAGYPRAYVKAVRLEPSTGSSISAAASQVGPAISTLLDAAAGAGASPVKVDLVAHSMGAVAARWYAAFVAPTRVRTVVTLAGANHGTTAVCGWAGAGPAELCAAAAKDGGPLAQLLHGDETPYSLTPDPPGRPHTPPTDSARIVYLAVWLEKDEWIVPTESAQLAGAGLPPGATPANADPPDGNYRIGGAGHDALLGSRRAATLVLNLLAAVDSLER